MISRHIIGLVDINALFKTDTDRMGKAVLAGGALCSRIHRLTLGTFNSMGSTRADGRGSRYQIPLVLQSPAVDKLEDRSNFASFLFRLYKVIEEPPRTIQ